MERPLEAVRVSLPTPYGVFEAHAFEPPSGRVHLALVMGDVDGERDVLTRLHSECLTGDVLGSLRCDCGIQLKVAMRAIAAQQRGVLIYATGHEGRGIGLVNKLRAYIEQDRGADTVQANEHLNLPIDLRDYTDSARVLRALGVRSIRLLTNNPRKVEALRAAGIDVRETEPLPTAPHARNGFYLHTKQQRLGHVRPAGEPVGTHDAGVLPAVDTTELLGPVRPRADRPYVVLKFAQTVDGRIATSTGDAKWISGEEERTVSHALRAACDAVLVGIGTVLQDDPQLTVRMVAGASPIRVVLDSTARIPRTARVLEGEAATTVITTPRAPSERIARLQAMGARVHVVAEGAHGVDVREALAVLRAGGVTSLLVEGGGRVITSLLAAGVVDRLIVGVAPLIVGSGTDAVGELGVRRVVDGISLARRTIHAAGADVLIGWDVEPAAPA